MSGVTETNACPFARHHDMTGCDCDCTIPPPSGFWKRLKWLFNPLSHVCVSGTCGEGLLPCERFNEYRNGGY